MGTIRAGMFRHRVTLQDPYDPESKDTTGDVADEWSDVADLWVLLMPLGGGEHYSATLETRVASMTHRVLGRWYPGINPKQRLVFEGRVFNIRSVRNVNELGYDMELYVEEDL